MSRPFMLAILVVAGVAVAALLTYRNTGGDQPMRARIVPLALRIAVLVLLVICLFRPTLILRASVPQQNFVAVLVDDSVQVPREYVKNGEIVLNISYDATSSLKLGNEFIEFKARFGAPFLLL